MITPIKIDKKLINQSELARQLDVSPAYICMILQGKRKNEELKKQIITILKNNLKAA